MPCIPLTLQKFAESLELKLCLSGATLTPSMYMVLYLIGVAIDLASSQICMLFESTPATSTCSCVHSESVAACRDRIEVPQRGLARAPRNIFSAQ